MTSTHEHFGTGAGKMALPLDTPDTKGNRRTCIGNNVHNSSIEWYGYIGDDGERISPRDLSFCQFCGTNNFTPDRVFLVTSAEYPGLIPNLVCDTTETNNCLKYGIDTRCLHYGGFRVNVNLINQDDTVWTSVTRIPTPKAMEAARSGVHIVGVPTSMGWELSIKGDPNGKYRHSDLLYKIKEAKFGDGRKVKVTDTRGSTNFYTSFQSNTGIRFNGYGGENTRFVFWKPSAMEKSHGLQATHDGESNKLYLTLSIHREVKKPRLSILRQCYEEGGYRDGGSSQMRGGAPQTRGGGSQMRGGGSQTRGGGDTVKGGQTRGQAKGGSPYGGGSNFSSHGNTFHTQTTVVDSTFPEVEDPVEMIVQLVNNESEEELIHFTRQLQSQVDGAKREEIEQMEKEKAQLEASLIEKRKVDARSKLFGHSEQEAHLM
jgi:hypothetical protein